jgi:hypothetical protein
MPKYHTNACNRYFAKDYYALDFDFDEGEPVFPVADGIVEWSGEAAGYGQFVYIKHDPDGDGKFEYESMYAHLQERCVSTGDRVTHATEIGKAGATGNTDGHVHLHFALYQGSQIAKQPGYAPYGGRAVLPEPFVGAEEYTDITPGMALTSAGSPTLNFTVRLQGRPGNHSANVSIEVRNPGSNSTIFSPPAVTTDSNGRYNGLVLTGVPPRNYDIFAKTRASLRGGISNRRLYSGSNTLDFGTLLVGDFNGDNMVNSIDNDILFTGWRNTASNPQPCPDNPEDCHIADFNLDSKVNSIDDAIFKANWGKQGTGGVGFTALHAANDVHNTVSAQDFGPATLSLEPFSSRRYEVGENFELGLYLSSGGRDVSGVDVIVRYDPCVLQVQDADPSRSGIQIVPGSIFPSYPLNTVDTSTGEIRVGGYGSLYEPFNGTHQLFATIQFRVIANTDSGQSYIWVDHDDFRILTVDSNATEYSVAQDILGQVFNEIVLLTGSPQRSDPTGAITNPLSGTYINQDLVPIDVSASDPCGQTEYVTIQKLSTDASNLAPNPSFEHGITSPDGWVPNIPGVPGTPNAEMSWDDTTAHSGTHSVRISNVVELGEWSTADWIPVDLSKEYALSVWIKSSKEKDNLISFDLLANSEGGCGIADALSVLEVSGDWTHYAWEHGFDPGSVVGCPPFDAVKIQLWFGNFTSELDTNSVWFDDVYFGPPEALEWSNIGVDSDGSDGWGIVWDATHYPDTTLALRAEISLDRGGFNRTETTSVLGIMLDRTLPRLESFLFSPPSPSSARVITIEASATDNLSGIDHIDVYVNSATDGSTSGSWNHIGTISGASGHVDWDTSGYANGVHRVVFDIQDNAGNWDLWTFGSQPSITYCFLFGDLDGSGRVDIVDIMMVASRWNTSVGDPNYDPTRDLDSDGDIDIVDIMMVAVHWRDRCE